MPNKCEICKKHYSVKELIRSLGNVWWKHRFCSAQCYTKYIVGE